MASAPPFGISARLDRHTAGLWQDSGWDRCGSNLRTSRGLPSLSGARGRRRYSSTKITPIRRRPALTAMLSGITRLHPNGRADGTGRVRAGTVIALDEGHHRLSARAICQPRYLALIPDARSLGLTATLAASRTSAVILDGASAIRLHRR